MSEIATEKDWAKATEVPEFATLDDGRRLHITSWQAAVEAGGDIVVSLDAAVELPGDYEQILEAE